MNDPIVAEVRRIRDAHAQQFQYDLDAICADDMAHQAQVGKRLVWLASPTLNPVERYGGRNTIYDHMV